MMVVRRIEPVEGNPCIRIRLRPTHDHGAHRPTLTQGSNHVRYVSPGLTLRLTTDASISAVLEESVQVLEEPITLLLGPDETISEAPARLGRRFYEETKEYWRDWVRGLSIPFEWQDAVIRAAITLKLCTFEDTGAVIAAMTTSVPEAAGTERNWDYRLCWLRDSYFVVHALNSLGATKTMEEYLRYITNITATAVAQHRLQPVYSITGRSQLTESIIDTLPGYRGMGPVRVGNQAYKQVQNDVYGSVVLAATQAFFDQRVGRPVGQPQFEQLEQIGRLAAENYDQPDAGIWEYRGRERVHTFSSVMCWAACDRLAKIARRFGLQERARHWRQHANRIHAVISELAWSNDRSSFTASFGGEDMDASLLMLHEIGFLAADDPRYISTVKAIEGELRRGSHLFRYSTPDDFGEPENAFNVCTFWYIEALAALGRTYEARELFENILGCRNTMGLLSEDLDPASGELWGNFPQTYSMVGIIHAAARLSQTWEEAF